MARSASGGPMCDLASGAAFAHEHGDGTRVDRVRERQARLTAPLSPGVGQVAVTLLDGLAVVLEREGPGPCVGAGYGPGGALGRDGDNWGRGHGSSCGFEGAVAGGHRGNEQATSRTWRCAGPRMVIAMPLDEGRLRPW